MWLKNGKHPRHRHLPSTSDQMCPTTRTTISSCPQGHHPPVDPLAYRARRGPRSKRWRPPSRIHSRPPRQRSASRTSHRTRRSMSSHRCRYSTKAILCLPSCFRLAPKCATCKKRLPRSYPRRCNVVTVYEDRSCHVMLRVGAGALARFHAPCPSATGVRWWTRCRVHRAVAAAPCGHLLRPVIPGM